jgi:transposase
MDMLFPQCAGLDVHKRTVVACTLTSAGRAAPQRETATFGTMTADLLALGDWLAQHGVTHVVMESTGEFWKPVYNLLEDHFTVWVVNAQHVKAVPGRKTDVQDAEWLADLLRHGLVRPSFIPPAPQRALRDLTRQRACLVTDRVAVVNRLHKVLEWANLKLTSVLTDLTGVSGRAILAHLLAGERDEQGLADLAKGRLRSKRAELAQALQGELSAHHRVLIRQHLAQLDFLAAQIAELTNEIAAQLEQLAPAPPPTDVDPATPPLTAPAAVEVLDTIPGVGRDVAEVVIAEVGPDMSRFGGARQLTKWAKLAPGNNESAGKRHSGRTGVGSRWLRQALVQAAHAAARTRGTYWAALYRRLVGRLGVKRTIIALARRLLTVMYYMLARREPYRELGASYYDERHKQQVVRRLQKRMEHLGYRVTVEAVAA